MKKVVIQAAVVLAAFAAYACFAWWEQDDFYIHLQYVHNLITRGEWSFSAGTPSYGTTSPLWILVVSLPGLLGVPLPLAAKLLSIGFAAGCVALLLRARDLFRSPAVLAAAVVAMVADHWFRLAAGSGMEATLTAFLAFALGLSLVRVAEATPRQLAWYGLLSGLLVLSRPEFFVLPAILLLAPRPRRPAPWLSGYALLLAAAAIVVLPWILYAITHFGSATPNTVAIKAAAPKAPLIPALPAILAAAKREASFFGPMYLPELLAIAAALLLGVRRPLRDGRAVPLAAWGLLAFLPAMYFVIHARGGEAISYRYAAPVLPLLVTLGFLQLDRLLERYPAIGARRAALAAACCVLAAGAGLSALHTPSLRRSRAYLDDVLVPYGKWLGAHAPPGARVACYDVGAVAYFSQRPVLDLVGLNNPEVVRHLDRSRQFDVNMGALRAFRPDYLVTFAHMDTAGLYDGLPVAETIFTREVVPYRFGGGGGPSHACSLWRLDWSKATPEARDAK